MNAVAARADHIVPGRRPTMKARMQLWLLCMGASTGAHAATFAAISIWVEAAARRPPRVELPSGEASVALVHFGSLDELPADQREGGFEAEVTLRSAPQVQDTTGAPEMTAEVDGGQQELASSIDALARPPGGERSRLIELWEAGRRQLAEYREAAELLRELVRRMRLLASAPARPFAAESPDPAGAIPDPPAVSSQTTQALAGAPDAAGPAPAAPVGNTGVVRAPSSARTNKPPEYPGEARRQRQSGTVLLHLVIEPDGRVSSVTIARSSGFELLDGAALDAARSWRFSAAIEGGIAIRCEADLPVEFVLLE